MAQYYNSYQPTPTDNNNFYASSSSDANQFYQSNIQGSIGSSSGGVGTSGNYGGGGSMTSGTVVGWWNAFGTGGMEGEPPLLEGKLLLHLPRDTSLTPSVAIRAGHQL